MVIKATEAMKISDANADKQNALLKRAYEAISKNAEDGLYACELSVVSDDWNENVAFVATLLNKNGFNVMYDWNLETLTINWETEFVVEGDFIPKHHK